ncbi:MAG TPA: response regulator [Kiritimatiellia bacterium]|nr:response regulator [Kiritimatiellia bacterium]HMO52467.1 response regulator [Kiritimatiellia bacterium]HMP00071.1 response regulator [Kiritimatiellia bacterium]HMP97796.1 response regulator [Kiritimatiellia bacterium]
MIAPEHRLRRVLVIDDEVGPRESLRILLKKEYEVLCADSVAKGLELLQEKQPDVVVSDIRMPGMNGIEGLRNIRKLDPEVPVIMLTGYGMLETAQEAIRLGANDYMKKPFDAHEMLAVIRRNVERGDLMRRREQSLKTLEDLNKQLLDEIAQKSRLASMGQASAELVHDLRNPITIILGYVQLLAQDLNQNAIHHASLPPDTSDYMDAIEQNVKRCKDLIESWLDLSRNQRMTLKPLNLNEVMAEIIAWAKPMALSKRAVIECRLPAQPVGILGHDIQLKRALQNIIGNALDAIPESTSGHILVEGSVQDGQARLVISDNGEGIESEHLPHIFEPFYTKKSGGRGTGLGLFITQKIIQDHGGDISVHSIRGEGTRVTLTFPML